MNVRQLRKLVLETINEKRRPKRQQRRVQNRNKVMAETLRRARRQLAEADITNAEEFYGTLLKSYEGSASNEQSIFKAYGLEDTNKNQALWASLYEDNPTGATVSGPTPIACQDLLPTQSEIGSANSLGNIFFGNGYAPGDGFDISKDAKSIMAAGSATFKTDILAAKGKGDKTYIIDGHHRWSQAYMLGPQVKINCLVLNMPGMSADDILQAVHVAISELETSSDPIANSIGKKFNGENMLKGTPSDIIKKYKDSVLSGNVASGLALSSSGMKPEFIQWSKGEITPQELADAGGSTLPLAIGENCDLDLYCQHFVDAITDMQEVYKSGDTSADAPARIMMPQADDMGVGGKEAYDHIASNKITVPGAGNSAGTANNNNADEDGEPINSSHYRRGNVMSEHRRQLQRWNKLAGLLKD